ncbi:hypothetical protein PSPTOT1_2838 [Pseudomonas syringae pv. tomato T1]|nr:hypothetical protein PSPTOT1_2838 [Pseudomonas syringae pv. tomato T1]
MQLDHQLIAAHDVGLDLAGLRQGEVERLTHHQPEQRSDLRPDKPLGVVHVAQVVGGVLILVSDQGVSMADLRDRVNVPGMRRERDKISENLRLGTIY